jgi:hypothetical protein
LYSPQCLRRCGSRRGVKKCEGRSFLHGRVLIFAALLVALLLLFFAILFPRADLSRRCPESGRGSFKDLRRGCPKSG